MTTWLDGTSTVRAASALEAHLRSWGIFASDSFAVGDGVNDQLAHLQAAIDKAAALNSGQGCGVIVDPGNYILSGTLNMKSGVSLWCPTAFKPNIYEVLFSDRRSGAIFTSASGATGWMIDGASYGRWGMSGISLFGYVNGGKTAGTGGIRVQGGLNVSVRDCAITNQLEQALLVQGGSSHVYRDLIISNSILNVTRAAQTGALDIDGTDHYLENLEVGAEAAATVTSSNLYCAAIRLKGSNCWVKGGCNGELSDVGLYVDGQLNLIDNFRADLNYGHGFVVPGYGNIFTSPLALNNGQATDNTYDGFSITGQGNQFTTARSTTLTANRHRYGARDTYSSYAPVDLNRWIAPFSEGHGTAPFNGVIVGASPLYPPLAVGPAAGTATPDVAQVTRVALSNYSGATTITNFLNGTAQQQISMIGNVNVTIANNATIKTNTGANKTLVATKVYTFTFYNGIWYEAE